VIAAADEGQRQARDEKARRQNAGQLAEGVGLGTAGHQAAKPAASPAAEPADAAFLLLQKDCANQADGDQDVNDQNDLH
jgi:hypothetical protein